MYRSYIYIKESRVSYIIHNSRKAEPIWQKYDTFYISFFYFAPRRYLRLLWYRE